jgi:hypothetical protein
MNPWRGWVRPVIALSLATLLAGMAHSQSTAQGSYTDLGAFKSPSGNIYCVASTDTFSGQPVTRLDCEVVNVGTARPPLPRPRDCTLDWGQRFAMAQRGRAGMVCYGDTIADSRYPVLAYGSTWRVAGFICDATTARVRCVNFERHGFELSRGRQTLF